MTNQNRIYGEDFNVRQYDSNGRWVRIEELNDMIQRGIISIDRKKLEKYHNDTRVIKYKNGEIVK